MQGWLLSWGGMDDDDDDMESLWGPDKAADARRRRYVKRVARRLEWLTRRSRLARHHPFPDALAPRRAPVDDKQQYPAERAGYAEEPRRAYAVANGFVGASDEVNIEEDWVDPSTCPHRFRHSLVQGKVQEQEGGAPLECTTHLLWRTWPCRFRRPRARARVQLVYS